MRIVIAGASGFVGRMLVPELRVRGADVMLLGRIPEALQAKFPDCAVSDYANLSQALQGADLLLNLAVVNSDAGASLSAYQSVNVEFAATLAQAAQDAGVRFINVSSTHALEAGNRSAYAQSKRDGVAAVDAVGGDVVHLYLPAIYGATFAGALRHLNRLPTSLARFAFGPISALKPTLSVTRLAEWLCDHAGTAPRELVLSDGQSGNLTYRAVSRVMDLAAAVGGLILFALPMLILWALIRKEGDGPAIFAQPRVGRGGQVFTCYKFRTMAIGTKQVSTHEVSSAAVTPLGAKLRRYKLDELPQLWNVLWGDMSLIGPRPCLPAQEELVRLRGQAGVLDTRPGISGLAQVAGVDMSDPARLVAWDARYIALRGLILDIRLILQTALGAGQGDRVGK
ncbi:hybrid nucleoside-diphosphate sugar epimerase/sugar transferase [Roseobacter sp. HKCC-CH-9208]|uniref:hybrid nucleoside-diphosphate sugar epimerase/sugar transferase n=1 Tax=Roseobacter sp. HKCC-CH-9208 TaxID=3120339 RepID=UPI0030EC1A41